MVEFPSQPDHFLLASQPEHNREGPDPREGLIRNGLNLLGPSVFLETFPQDSDTDKGHKDWQSMSGSRVGAWSLLRADSLLSTQRWTRKVYSVIFPSRPENGNICALGCVLDAPQDTVWRTSAGVTPPGGGSGWPLRKESLDTAPGDRELRPGREQGKGLRLGQREVFSTNCVC